MESIKKLEQALIKQDYIVKLFDTKEAAVSFLNKELDNKVIGIGGSQTVEQMGLYEALVEHNTVYWHDRMPDNMSVMEVRQAAFRAPVYISSVNGISEQGDIVNIDATGNRVAAISFGPKDIYLLVGKNKITVDYESAMIRARNIAAPLNARRLNRKTPCAVKADKCYDCISPDRICRNFVVFRNRPTGANYHVMLINEDLGF